MKRGYNVKQRLHRTTIGECHLMQFNWSRRGRHGLVACLTTSFTSIVTRPGKIGLFVDKPYYCYGGPHRYRRIPLVPTIKLLTGAAIGYAAEALQEKRRAIARFAADVRMRLDVPRMIRKYRMEHDFDKFLRDTMK